MFLIKALNVSAGLVLCTASFAQTRSDTLRHLDEVIVVTNRHKELIPAQRLAGERLAALGSFSVADAIRYFSGVQIKDYGGIGGLKTVDVRSMGTHHLGVFYDGIQLGNAQNGQIDLGKFSLDNIEEIALYNGQKSEIFQSAKDFGSAGTIYLRTRRPRFTGNRKTNIKTVFRTGSFDLVNPSVLWEQKIGGSGRDTARHISMSVNAESVYSSGKYPFRYRKVLSGGAVAWDTTAVRQNGDIHSFRLEGGLNGFINNGMWHIKGYFYDSEKGIPGAIVNNVWKRSQRQWDRNFFAQGSFQKQIAKNCDVSVNAKYAVDRMRYLNPDTTLMYIDNTFLQREIYASVANKYAVLPHWDVNLSADYQWNTLDASLQDFVYPKRNTALVALATAFEWKRLKAQASVLGTFVKDETSLPAGRTGETPSPQVKAGGKVKKEYTPAVFLSWQPLSPLRLQAFYKRIFRMPTFNDLYYTDIGNAALRPEYTTQYDVGFQYTVETRGRASLQIRADAYYNEVTDKIIAVPKGNGQYRWMMMNLGYVEIRGVDVSTMIGLLPVEALHAPLQVNISLNYTFQKAQDFSNPADSDPRAGTYGRQIAYIPWHNGSAIVNMNWQSWDLNYSFIYVGERYHHSSNIRENYEQPWYTHDLTLGKTWRFRMNGRGNPPAVRISAEINNVLNQYYDVVLNYPMPGRNYKLILKIEI
jgi:outer membrane cobalamin receptor